MKGQMDNGTNAPLFNGPFVSRICALARIEANTFLGGEPGRAGRG